MIDTFALATFRNRAGLLWKLGIPAIPLRPKSKEPAIQHGALDGTTDRDVLLAWVGNYDAESNCGAVARYDGFWFLDDDLGTLAETYRAATGKDLPRTFTVRTSRGYHYYFRHDSASRVVRYGGHENSGVISIPGFKGEARCNNQYVVAPGSVHPSGSVYEVADDAPIVAAPVELLEWLQEAFVQSEALKPKPEKPKTSSNHTGDSGFKKLFDAVGYWPLVKWLKIDSLEPGEIIPCPMPHHKHSDYTPCFGPLKEEPELFHCLGNCGWSGDLFAAIYHLDGGSKKYRNMYDVARAVCAQEGLTFETFFRPEPRTPEPDVPQPECRFEEPEISQGPDIAAPQGIAERQTEDKPGKDPDMSSECFADLKSKPVVWLWKDRIPKDTLVVFSGNPDCGKTTVSIDIIARYTTGRNWADGAVNGVEPGCVLVLTEEDDCETTYLPRLIAAGADVSRVHHVTGIPVGRDASTEKRMVALDADLSRLKLKIEHMRANGLNLGLVVVDPITNYMGKADMNKEQEVRRVLSPIASLCRESQITFIAVGHFNKRLDVAALHKVGGAVGMTGVSRAVWLFAKSPDADGEYAMMLGKGNLTKKRTGLKYRIGEKDLGGGITAPFIAWGAETTSDADSVLAAAANPEEKKSAKAVRFLTDYFANLDGPQKSDAIIVAAKRVGIASATLFRARKSLGIEAKQQNREWLWTWRHDSDEGCEADSDFKLGQNPVFVE